MRDASPLCGSAPLPAGPLPADQDLALSPVPALLHHVSPCLGSKGKPEPPSRQCPVSEFRGGPSDDRDRHPSSLVSSVSFRSRIWCPDAAIPAAPGGSSEARAERPIRRLPALCWPPRRQGPTLVPGPAAGGAGGCKPQGKTRPQKSPWKDLVQSTARARARASLSGTEEPSGTLPGQRGRPGMETASSSRNHIKSHLFSRRTGLAFSVRTGVGMGDVMGGLRV